MNERAADAAKARRIETMLVALQLDLPAPLRQELAQLPLIELAANTQVFDSATRCAGFPLLMSGQVRVYRPLLNGRSIELYRVAPSEPCILSLGCLLGGGDYPACGVSVGPTMLVVLPPPMFEHWMAEVVPFRTAMFRLLGERLVSVMQLVEEVSSTRLEARLAAALLTHLGPDLAQPALVTHQQLADALGTVREMTSRLLDDLARRGILVLGRGRITVIDPEQLRRLAEAR
ncbi:MAG: Crp/Fnr family transcriptional regulator [Pseudomonadota bacterium]